MRTKFALKNSFYSVFGHIALTLAGIWIRKLILENINLEYLGYESLFSSIFAVLSIAELGAGNMFTYKLYTAIAQKNKAAISKLMGMYKLIYRYVGMLVLALGIILFLFLPAFVKSPVTNWAYVRLIYIMQFTAILSTYFLGYKRTLFIADQCEYEVVRVDTFVKAVAIVGKAIALAVFHSYWMYLLVMMGIYLSSDIIIAIKYKKKYSDIKEVPAKFKDFKDDGSIAELKNLMVSRIAGIIYGSTDSILVSAINGIKYVALYGNYFVINTGVITIFHKTMQPLNASIGNLINTESREKTESFYNAYDTFCFFMASIALCCFFSLYQTTVEFIFGAEYLLPLLFVLAISINNYITIKGFPSAAIRNSVGNYRLDRTEAILSAVCNIVLSIILGKLLGIAGVFIATAVGHLFIFVGRIKVSCKEYFHISLTKHLWRELFHAILAIVEMSICYFATINIETNILGIALRLFICVAIPLAVNLIIFHRTKGFHSMIEYFESVTNVALHKRKSDK